MARKKIIEYFYLFSKNIIIPFEKYYGLEFEDYNEFNLSISQKKIYSKISDLIVKENNLLLNRDEVLANEFIYEYFTIKYAIDRGEYKDKSTDLFINDIVSIIFTKKFMEMIKDYVDDNYITNVDEDIDETKNRYDPGTTFKDRHYKMMYQISSMSRLIIPLMTHYIYNYNISDPNKFIMDCFMALFKVVEYGTDANIYAKLHLFVTRTINKTLYTDATMWDRLMIFNVTKENVCEEALNKIITNIIPKYSFEKNIMKFNSVVVRKTIMLHVFRKKDPYTVFSLTSNDGQATDDDAMSSEIEIFASYNTQRDESLIMYRKHATARDVEILRNREGVVYEDGEIEFYSDSKRYHEFQKTVICSMFSRYFSGVENIINGCTKDDWIRLMIIAKRMLERLNLNILSEFLSSEKQQFSYKKLSKSVNNQIDEDPIYKELVEKKYGDIGGIFERRNFIKGMIITLINNTYTYNSFNNPLNGQYIEKDETKIVKEVLTFFKMLIL